MPHVSISVRSHLAIGAYDGSLRIYDFSSKQLVRETVLADNNRIHSLAFSPSGESL